MVAVSRACCRLPRAVQCVSSLSKIAFGASCGCGTHLLVLCRQLQADAGRGGWPLRISQCQLEKPVQLVAQRWGPWGCKFQINSRTWITEQGSLVQTPKSSNLHTITIYWYHTLIIDAQQDKVIPTWRCDQLYSASPRSWDREQFVFQVMSHRHSCSQCMLQELRLAPEGRHVAQVTLEIAWNSSRQPKCQVFNFCILMYKMCLWI